ncbi:helix-turn-helix domain-containing protein [Robinsoniella peoriensis]|uniref:helix-turn-helix domain-containing protein n=1 Tax=Robinsoniella peoriensis TaxID=180332 RepID=UPI003643FC6F
MFIDNLEIILRRKQTSTYKMCKDTNIAPSSVSGWKQGKMPSIDKLIEIAKYLNVTADELLGLNITEENFTQEEKEVISEYRNARPEIKESARVLLRAGQQETKSSAYKTG